MKLGEIVINLSIAGLCGSRCQITSKSNGNEQREMSFHKVEMHGGMRETGCEKQSATLPFKFD
jgi:hypothetical protein